MVLETPAESHTRRRKKRSRYFDFKNDLYCVATVNNFIVMNKVMNKVI